MCIKILKISWRLQKPSRNPNPTIIHSRCPTAENHFVGFQSEQHLKCSHCCPLHLNVNRMPFELRTKFQFDAMESVDCFYRHQRPCFRLKQVALFVPCMQLLLFRRLQWVLFLLHWMPRWRPWLASQAVTISFPLHRCFISKAPPTQFLGPFNQLTKRSISICSLVSSSFVGTF